MGMIGDIAEGIKAVGQIAVKPLLAIALASGSLLYAPAHVIAAAGLADFLAIGIGRRIGRHDMNRIRHR